MLVQSGNKVMQHVASWHLYLVRTAFTQCCKLKTMFSGRYPSTQSSIKPRYEPVQTSDRGVNKERCFVGPDTMSKEELVGDSLGCSGHEIVELKNLRGGSGSEKQDYSSGLQESKMQPLQRFAWKYPMEYGPRKKRGPGEVSAQERTIPKSRKWSKSGRRPVEMSKECQIECRKCMMLKQDQVNQEECRHAAQSCRDVV